jgi:hypothetical protein
MGINITPIIPITVIKIDNIRYNKSKFLTPSLIGNLLTSDSQLLSNISLIDKKRLRLLPFLYSSINCAVV